MEQLLGRLEFRVGAAGIETGTATVRYDEGDDDEIKMQETVFSGEGLGTIGLVVRPRSIERKQGTVEVEIVGITENKVIKKKREEDPGVKRSYHYFTPKKNIV